MGISDPKMAIAAQIVEEILSLPGNAALDTLERNVTDLSAEVASNILWILERPRTLPGGIKYYGFEDDALLKIVNGANAADAIRDVKQEAFGNDALELEIREEQYGL